MQRERVVQEKGSTEIRTAVEELSLMKKLMGDKKKISTFTFLRLSNILINVLDKIGPTMAVMRQDIHGNIERLEELYVSDPLLYSSLEEILEKDVSEGTTGKRSSCSKAVVWLTRSISFSLALLGRLEEDPHLSLEQVVEEAYKSTLKPWHGWISSAAYKTPIIGIGQYRYQSVSDRDMSNHIGSVSADTANYENITWCDGKAWHPEVAMKLIPERQTLVSLLIGQGQDCEELKGDIHKLLSLLQPVLDATNALLRKFRLDRLKST